MRREEKRQETSLLELGLLAEIAAHHAWLLVLSADLADRLTGALVVGVARSDLNTSSACTLRLIEVADDGRLSDRRKSGRGESTRRKSRGLSRAIPHTHLRVHIEHCGRGTRHSLPSSTEEVVGGRLALEVVRARLRVSGQGIDHPRTDTLVLSIRHSSLHERAGLGLDDGGLISLGSGTVLLLSGGCLAVNVKGKLLRLAETRVYLWHLSGGSGKGLRSTASGRGKRWLVRGSQLDTEASGLRRRARAVLVLGEGHRRTLSGLGRATLGIGIERDRDRSENLGSRTHTVELTVGTGTLVWGLSDLFDLNRSCDLRGTEVVGSRVGRVTQGLLTLDRSSCLASSGRSDEFVSRQTLTE